MAFSCGQNAQIRRKPFRAIDGIAVAVEIDLKPLTNSSRFINLSIIASNRGRRVASYPRPASLELSISLRGSKASPPL